MSNVVFKKENGDVTIVQSTDELEKAVKETYHMCWDCANARSDKCTKVRDRVKKGIGSYEYITDGYQIIDENKEVDTFIVTNCKNFVKDEVRKKTSEEKKYLERLKKSLLMQYFDADTPEEAYIMQSERMNYPELTEEEKEAGKKDPYANRRITDPRGKRPSERLLEEMKSRFKR